MLKFLGIVKAPGQPIARGPNVVLLPMRKGDLRKVRIWFNDSEMIQLSFGLLGDEEVLEKIARDYMREIVDRLSTAIAIETTCGKLIGFMRYSSRSEGSQIVRLGIMIGERDWWGKGAGTEAMMLILRHLFENKGIERVELDTAEFNARALRCFEKCGFVRNGQSTEVNFLNGQFSHKVLMAMNRDDFKFT